MDDARLRSWLEQAGRDDDALLRELPRFISHFGDENRKTAVSAALALASESYDSQATAMEYGVLSPPLRQMEPLV